MTSRLAQVAIDATDTAVAAAVAASWSAVLGWSELEREDGLISIGPTMGGAGIDVIAVPEAKTLKNRLHLDLRADGDRAPELARLLALGARRVDVGQAPDVTWTVLADPEGNEFCLLQGGPHARTVRRFSGPAWCRGRSSGAGPAR